LGNFQSIHHKPNKKGASKELCTKSLQDSQAFDALKENPASWKLKGNPFERMFVHMETMKLLYFEDSERESLL
jgi:hypothetical protein